MKIKPIAREAGFSTLLVLSVITTLAVFVGAALDFSMTMQRQSMRLATLQKGMEVGDGALEYAFGSWREICRQNTTLAMPTSYFTGINPPSSTYFPSISGYSATTGAQNTSSPYTVSNFRIKATDPQFNVMSSDTANPTPATGQDDSTNSYFYMASADVSLPVGSSRVTTNVRRIFQKQVMSPWNWAIFYADSLEIHPGPAFTVTGWVHTNATLFTGHNSLTFASKVTYGADWNIGFAPGDSTHPETPVSPNYPSNLPPALDAAHQPFGLDSTRIFSTTNSNTNDDSYHELLEIPSSSYSDPLAGQRYYDQAGVKILIDNSGNVKYYNKSGTQVTNSSTGYDKKLYTAFKNATSVGTTIQDNREQTSVRLVTIDVGSITSQITSNTLPAIGNGNASSFNQIVYISDTSANTTVKRAVKLINGTTLPPQGMTFATNNPVYVKGDFNTGGSSPASNSGDPTQPTVSGYTRQPACIACDAINVLSNAWSDSNSSASLSSRIASNTTINAAFLAGIVPSANGYYSGGAENFPRFHEDWSNKTLTYYGSMIELYPSQQFQAPWGSSNVYSPPSRKWYFDTRFRQTEPPGTLMIYSYLKNKWYIN